MFMLSVLLNVNDKRFLAVYTALGLYLIFFR
jgi:hypothetical protein